MKIHYSDKFAENVEKLSKDIKKILKGKLEIMIENPRHPWHPSLRTKKIQGQSILMGIRMTWQYTEDCILLRNIGEHDKALNDS